MKHLYSFALSLAALGSAAAQSTPVISQYSPQPNATDVPRTAPVTVTFSDNLSSAPASTGALKVFSSQQGGKVSGATTAASRTLSFTPAYSFKAGEVVSATVTKAAQSAAGVPLARPAVYQFTAAATGGTGRFGESTVVSVRAGAQAITTADIDGDHDLDILTACYFDGVVSIRLNDGKGNFSGGLDVPVGDGPQDLTVADLDGDGDLDILTANYRAYSVSVRFNLGNNSFGGGTDLVVGRATFGVATGDVDGDGDLDLIAVNPNSSTASIRLNNGRGEFATGSDVAIGTTNDCLDVADVDGDGDLDILTGDLINNKVNIRLNNGAGVFTYGSDPAVGNDLIDVRAVDVDRDGDVDLLTVNRSSNSVSVRLNNGKGVFSGGTDINVGRYPYGLAVGDIDSDGDMDAVTANFSSSNATLLTNNGDGTFAAGPNIATDTNANPSSTTLADIDDDGDLDLLITSDRRVFVYFNINKSPALGTSRPATLLTSQPYPNPAHSSTTIGSAPPPGTTQATLSLYNTLGQEVRRQVLNLSLASQQHELDITGVSPGLYVLRLEAGELLTSTHLVVE